MDVYFGKFIYDVILAVFKHVVTPEKAEQIGKTWGNLTTFSRREVAIGVLSLTVGGVATGWYMRRSIRLQLEEAARSGRGAGGTGAGGDPFGMGGGLVKSGAGKLDLSGLQGVSSSAEGIMMNANASLRQRMVAYAREHWKVLPSTCTGAVLVMWMERLCRFAWRRAETRLAEKATKIQEVDVRMEYILHQSLNMPTVIRATVPEVFQFLRRRTSPYRRKLKIALIISLMAHTAALFVGPPSVAERGLFILFPLSFSDALFTVLRHSPILVASPEGLVAGALSALTVTVAVPIAWDRLTRPPLVLHVAELMTSFQPTPAQDVSPEMVAAAGGTRFSHYMDSHLHPLRGFLEETFVIPPLQRLEATTILGSALQHSLSERRVVSYLQRSSLRSADLRVLVHFFNEYPRIWLVTLVCEVMEDIAALVQRVDLPVAVQQYLLEWFKDGFLRKIPDALEVEDADVLLHYLEGKVTKTVLRHHFSVHMSSRRMKNNILPLLFRFPSLFATYIRNKEEKREKEICDLVVQLADRILYEEGQGQGGLEEAEGRDNSINNNNKNTHPPPLVLSSKQIPSNSTASVHESVSRVTDGAPSASGMHPVASSLPQLDTSDAECLQELIHEALLRKKFIVSAASPSTVGSPPQKGAEEEEISVSGVPCFSSPVLCGGTHNRSSVAPNVSSPTGSNTTITTLNPSPLRQCVVPVPSSASVISSHTSALHSLPHSPSEAVVAFSGTSAASGWNIRNKLNSKNIPLCQLEKMKEYLEKQLGVTS